MKYTIVNKDNEVSKELTEFLYQKLDFLEINHGNPELVICVGGDGTILNALHKYMHLINQVRFVGIHTGTLGFFTDYTKDEIDVFIEDLKRNEYKIYESHLLEIKVDGEMYHALNEMRIENIIRTQSLDIYIDNEYFETFNGSGICVSTQAGSTAYNRALKGAVVDDGIQLLQMAEVTGIHHHLSHSLGNPYIMKCNRNIKITSSNFKGAYLCYDHKYFPIDSAVLIECTTSEKKIRFARYREYSYLKRLKNLY